MGLGRRNARQHETVGFQKNAMDSTVFWEFKPQQQVMTVDGVPGVVTAVLDGPYPGTEEYEVTLDNGLGGGSYTASQLSPLAGTTASHDHEATGLHLASDDYPEMGSILYDRPPIERMTFSAARGDSPFEIRHEVVDTGGMKFPRRVDMTAHHPETGEQVGSAHYFPPKRKGGPISIDQVKADAPGVASAMLNEIEARHPGSRTHFMNEVKRNNNNPDVTGHQNEDFGKPSDWDTHYPNVADTIHRGIALKLPSYSASVVNSPGNTKEEHLDAIHREMPTGPNIGTHWTENEHSAQLFAHNAIADYRNTIPVVLHAEKPARKDIETRQPHLYRGGVLPYGNGYAKENEIPVRRGREVKVTGISWKPDAPHPDADEHGWLHHTYDEPKHHTATLTTTAYGWDDDDDEGYGDHDEYGEHEEEPRQDWDHILSGVDEIHRGLGVKLHPSIHRIVHDPSRPVAERAHILMREIGKGDPQRRQHGHGVGTHWTTEQGVAEDFAERNNPGAVSVGDSYKRMLHEKNHMWGTNDEGDPKPQPATAVVLHAHPTRESIDENPDPFSHGSSDIYDYHDHGEREVPYHPGADVHIKGISWKPIHGVFGDEDEDYTRHDFEDGGRHHHAVMEDLADEDVQEAEPELPPCAYCGSDQTQIVGDTGRAQQARCQVCGGMMSAPYGLQFKPELIGDPSNHPKDDPDPASGGVPGAANMRVPVKRMNDSDYTASLHEAGRVRREDGWEYEKTNDLFNPIEARGPEGQVDRYYGTGLSGVRHPHHMPTPLYHGTRHEIPEGEQIVAGKPGNFVKRMKHVYMADDPEEAAKYAGPYGHVYQVQPTGFYGHRSDAKGASWATEDPVDIVGIHRGPTHRPGEDGKPVQIEGMLHIARTVSWDEIGSMHPHVYGDADIHGEDAEGADGPRIGDAAKYLAFERPGHQDAEDHSVDELEFHPMRVHPRHIDFHPSGMHDQRVRNALEGYKTNPDSVPPLVLVKRHNVYQVADGHHRAEAAASLGKSVRAYVAHSPHPDEPFADGEKGPFYGAQPLPKEVQDENNLHAHMQNEHGYAEEQLAGKSDKDIARYHDQKHFDCPAEFHAKMGSLHTANDDYRLMHQAPGNEEGNTSWDKYHGTDPDEPVRIYRAAPHHVRDLHPGDWVTQHAEYAHDHAHQYDGSRDWPVMTEEVPAKHLWTDHNDHNEWGYNGPSIHDTDVHHEETDSVIPRHEHDEMEEELSAEDAKRRDYRGGAITLPKADHDFVHGNAPVHERAQRLLHHLPKYDDGMVERGATGASDEDADMAQIDAEEKANEIHTPEHPATQYVLHEHPDQREGAPKGISWFDHSKAPHPDSDDVTLYHDDFTHHKMGVQRQANERDWCTFRRNARCYYPGPAGPDGLRMSTPQDRGPCAWDYWQQQVCPISEPGPMALMQAKGSLVNDDIRDPEFRFHFTASWSDVRAKAKRIRSEGKVNITVATHEGVGGEVKGDHHVYETLLTYVPGTSKVGAWECGCKWAAFAWGRSPAYRRFEGRMCSHALAMQFEAQARGMFGRAVEPNSERPKWLRHHTPVVTQYERDTGENLTRRAVPPGNMRRTYEGAHPQVYLRFGKWPEDERSHNNVMGWKEDGVSVYDLDHQGEPKDPDAGMNRWHDHDESCGPDCDLDSYNEDFANAVMADYLTLTAADGEINHLEVQRATDKFRDQEADRHQDDATYSTNWEPLHRSDIPEHEHGSWMFMENGSPHDEDSDFYRNAPEPLTTYKHGITRKPLHLDARGGAYVRRFENGENHFYGPASASSVLHSNGHYEDLKKMRATPQTSYNEDYIRQRNRNLGDAGFNVVSSLDIEGVYDENHSLDLAHPPVYAQVIEQLPEIGPVEAMKWMAALGMTHAAARAVLKDASAELATGQLHYEASLRLLAEEEHGEHEKKRCPDCGSMISVNDEKCPHCHHVFMKHEHHHGAKDVKHEPPSVSGVALKAADTGRVLMLQRGLHDEDDPAAGTWEFPGGHHEEGDRTSLDAGIREWEEETGHPFPEGGVVHHTWTSPNGVYQGHVVVIPEEGAVQFGHGRQVVNPDNPDGDQHEQAAWWDPDHARKNPALREELKIGTPWKEIKAAGNAKTAATADPLYGLEEASPMSPPQHSTSTNPASSGWATTQDPHSWDDPEENSTNFGALPADGYLGSLHDTPEPALPSTDGAEAELDDERDNADPSQYDENDAELTPNTTLASAGGTQDIVARFQATAGARALGGGGGEGNHAAQQANNKEIANAAKKFLTKSALKDFNFAEQQELINEGARDKTMARNSDVLNIEGTHYSALEAALAAEDVLEDSADLFA